MQDKFGTQLQRGDFVVIAAYGYSEPVLRFGIVTSTYIVYLNIVADRDSFRIGRRRVWNRYGNEHSARRRMTKFDIESLPNEDLKVLLRYIRLEYLQ